MINPFFSKIGIIRPGEKIPVPATASGSAPPHREVRPSWGHIWADSIQRIPRFPELPLMLPHPDFWYRFREGSMSRPWSQGQHVGSQSMIKHTIMRLVNAGQMSAASMAQALYLLNTVHSRSELDLK